MQIRFETAGDVSLGVTFEESRNQNQLDFKVLKAVSYTDIDPFTNEVTVNGYNFVDQDYVEVEEPQDAALVASGVLFLSQTGAGEPNYSITLENQSMFREEFLALELIIEVVMNDIFKRYANDLLTAKQNPDHAV